LSKVQYFHIIEEVDGMLAEGPSLTQELLAERAKELEREEAKLRR
jgi:hypothetical protein